MTFSFPVTADLGPASQGATVEGQLYDSAGDAVGAAWTDFANPYGGVFVARPTVPDGSDGVFVVYRADDPTVYAAVNVHPSEGERVDMKLSALPALLWAHAGRTLSMTQAALATLLSLASGKFLMKVYRGYDYLDARGTAFTFSRTTYPDLSDTTAAYLLVNGVQHAAEVTDTREVRLDLAGAQTDALAVGKLPALLVAVWSDVESVIDEGTVVVRDGPTA